MEWNGIQHKRKRRREPWKWGSYLLANLILIIRYTACVFVVENRWIAHHFSSFTISYICVCILVLNLSQSYSS